MEFPKYFRRPGRLVHFLNKSGMLAFFAVVTTFFVLRKFITNEINSGNIAFMFVKSEHQQSATLVPALRGYEFLQLGNKRTSSTNKHKTNSKNKRKKKKCLNFLHIPKVAGAAVEKWARKHKLSWGKYGLKSFLRWPKGRCSSWHYPPAHSELLREKYYDKCTTFCIVREPISRLVSEHLYKSALEYSRDKIRNVANVCAVNTFRKRVMNSLKSKDPWIEDCHYISQAYYVDGPGGLIPPGGSNSTARSAAEDGESRIKTATWSRSGKYCQRILRLEDDDMDTEFNALMKEFDLELRWPKKHILPYDPCKKKPAQRGPGGGTNQSESAACKALSHKRCKLKDLLPYDLKQYLEDFYADDYERFGFTRTTRPGKKTSVFVAHPVR